MVIYYMKKSLQCFLKNYRIVEKKQDCTESRGSSVVKASGYWFRYGFAAQLEWLEVKASSR